MLWTYFKLVILIGESNIKVSYEFIYIIDCMSHTDKSLFVLHHTSSACNIINTHYVVLYLCLLTVFLARCISSLLSKKGLMAHALVDSRLGGLFVIVPATTKRLKISCLLLSCLALGTMSQSSCKGYCLQDLHRPSFPFQVGLLQPDETASGREKEEDREQRRGGRRRVRKRESTQRGKSSKF